MRPPFLACLITAFATACAAPAYADQEIAKEQRPFVAAAYGDTVVWSSYDTAAKSFRLVTLSNGVPTALPVAPSPQAFDVSVGPGPDRSPVAVYARCTRRTPLLYTQEGVADASAGCDIYRYDFASGSESKVATASSSRYSEVQPSIRGRRIAFVRAFTRKPSARPRNAVYTASTAGPAHLRRQPNPPAPRGARVEGVSLTKRGLFFVWRAFEADSAVSHPILVRVVGHRVRQLDRIGSGGAAFGQLLSPSVQGSYVYYARLIFGRGRLWRFGLSSGRFAVGPKIASDGVIARTGGSFLLSNWLSDGLCTGNVLDPPSASMCTLTLTGPVTFQAHARPRGETT